MFDTLTKGFRAARNRLQGLAEISEENIDQALRDVRLSLLEADVEFNVTKRFLAEVKEQALGQVIQTKAEHKGRRVEITPADKFIQVCQDALVEMMSAEGEPIQYVDRPKHTGIMMVGLQGAGKTTSAAKLARLLASEGRKPLLVAADLQRPGAVEQLQVLGEQISVPVFSIPGGDPVEICRQAKGEAKKHRCDTVIYDTAGRLAIDEALMEELVKVKDATAAENILLTVDAMIGQDSVKTAAAFHERLGISGVVLTKLDGDARGGSALSIKQVTGAPIRFAGMGEGVDKLEPFRPDGMASRILGFGDVVGLMKDFEGVVDSEQAEKDAARMLQGQFSLDDFLEQIRMIKQMGPLQDIFDKLPFFPDGMPDGVNLDDGELVKVESIVSSMTARERIDTDVFKKQPSRLTRVARGCGRAEKDVAELIERFAMMRDMMGGIGQQAGMLSKIPGVKQLANARRLKDAIKLGGGGLDGNPMMGGLANELLEGLVAGGMPGMPGMGEPSTPSKRKPADKKKKKNLRKMQRKSRRKAKR